MPLLALKLPDPDSRRWLELHGTKPNAGEIRFECRCKALTPEGRCSVYEVRPFACVTYPAGGPDCLDTVRRRRTPEQYQQIREAGDPERVHS